MFRKPKRGHGSSDGHDDGLMITPLLDLLVSLIPILIIGVVMTRINVVDVAVSKPVANAKPSKANFDLSLKVKGNEVEILLNGKSRAKISRQGPQAVTQLHKEFVSIKKEFPNEFELKVEPENETALTNIMEIIDAARETQSGDPEMVRKDDATGKDVKIKYLFPRIVLRGVYT